MDILFTNPGKKIQGIAIATFIIEVIGSIVGGFITMCTDEDLILAGLITIITGPIAAWISAVFLYGLGELIQTNSDSAMYLSEIWEKVTGSESQRLATPNVNSITGMMAPNSWRCSCGRVNANYVSSCTCGKTKRDAVMKAPAKRDTVVQEQEEETYVAPVARDGWICSCGREHAAYVSTCTCGKTKREAVGKVPAKEVPVVDPKDGWVCTCGTVNANYVSSCTCGKTKREVKLEQQQKPENQ